jgi:microcin C transport system permease protein
VGAYILRRLLLVIPTLLGIMVVNFALVQFVPGGPIEQIIARIEGRGDVFETISGGGGEEVAEDSGDSSYAGARGLPPQFIADLEREFGFDKPPLERFLLMMWNYVRFDFGESWFRSETVVTSCSRRCRVDHAGALVHADRLPRVDPLGIRKAVRDGTPFDTWTSARSSWATRSRASCSRSC